MKLSYIWTSVCGSGYSPVAPGTAGSLASVVLWPLFFYMPIRLALGLWCVLFVISWYYTSLVLKGESEADPSWIVIDEALAVWMIPIAFHESMGVVWIWTWVLFRILDILKPWPINAVERMKPDVLAVIMDDIAAGIIAILLMKFWY